LEKEAEKRGYKFRVTHAQAKLEQQLVDVEDMVAQKPAIVILGPIDVEGSAEKIHGGGGRPLHDVVRLSIYLVPTLCVGTLFPAAINMNSG
jgi:hypothetical protein